MEPISLAADFLGPDLVPVEELADCARTVLERDGKTILSYGPAAGYAPLRALIGQWFNVHPSRVVLTNGSLDGLSVLANLVAASKNVVVEYPLYDRAERALLATGAALLGATADGEGMNTAELESTLVQYATPALVYTIPTFHNPTGSTMSLARRRHLLAIVEGRSAVQVHGMVLVEDDSYSLTRFEGEAEHALFDLSGKTSVYCSSFSTTLAPGLRVGWFILPEALAVEMEQAASATYITPSQLGQAIVFEFLSRGSFEPHLERLRAGLRLRRDAMLAALATHIPEARCTRPEGGFFLWVELPGQPDGREVLARAEGVTALVGTSFSAVSSWLRLSYSHATPAEIETGIGRLAAAL